MWLPPTRLSSGNRPADCFTLRFATLQPRGRPRAKGKPCRPRPEMVAELGRVMSKAGKQGHSGPLFCRPWIRKGEAPFRRLQTFGAPSVPGALAPKKSFERRPPENRLTNLWIFACRSLSSSMASPSDRRRPVRMLSLGTCPPGWFNLYPPFTPLPSAPRPDYDMD
jgi:hypothetical protein